MPTVEQNLSAWDVYYDWPDDGEEWSRVWGGSETQWFTTLLPRIHAFLPTDTILEIAPGHGRWTRFLKHYCSHLAIVDVSANCIDACKSYFSSCSHIAYHVNDGRSLHMIEDRSIDFAFSFDSLVHAEADVIESYLHQMAAKLKPNGVGFIHHSHIGRYRRVFSVVNRVPDKLQRRLKKIGLVPHDHWRAHSMTAQLFERQCARAGLVCIGQELVNWRSRLLIDAFSMFTSEGSVWARPNRIMRNGEFMKEAGYVRQLSEHYSGSSFAVPVGMAPGGTRFWGPAPGNPPHASAGFPVERLVTQGRATSDV